MNLTRSYHENQADQTEPEEEFSIEDMYKPLSEEDKPLIYEESPIDEEGAAKIDAIAPVSADDTWTICVYMVGSNLEDMDENDLSYVTDVMIADQKEQLRLPIFPVDARNMTGAGDAYLAGLVYSHLNGYSLRDAARFASAAAVAVQGEGTVNEAMSPEAVFRVMGGSLRSQSGE